MRGRTIPIRLLVLIAITTLTATAASTIQALGQPAWSRSTPSGTSPSPRNQIGVGDSYDEVHDRLILYSGNNYGSFPNDVWVLKNATQPGSASAWEQLFPVGPVPLSRQGHAVGYDPESNRLTIYGGWGPRLMDAWVLTNANGLGGTAEWIELPSAPVSRTACASGYDPSTHRLIIFGGTDAHYYTSLGEHNDVWVLKDANGVGSPEWLQLQTVGAAPSPRYYAASAYDPGTNRLIVHGGNTYTPEAGWALSDELWVLTNANGLGGTPEWLRMVAPNGPAPLFGHAMSYNPVTKRALVVGGESGPGASPMEAWLLENAEGTTGPPMWRRLAAVGTVPETRNAFAFGYAPATDSMVMATGGSITGYTNEVWLLEHSGLGLNLVAAAGPDQTTDEAAIVTLDGSASTRDNASYYWEQVAGPAVTLTAVDGLSTQFSAPTLEGGVGGNQTLTFRLTVTVFGMSKTDTVDVTVRNVNHRPVADAGANQAVAEATVVRLSGLLSYDPDDDTLTSHWEQTAGPIVALSGTDTIQATFEAPLLPGGTGDAAVVRFRLTVSDGELSAASEVEIRVEQVNHAPVAQAGADQTRDEATTVALNGAGSSDPDGDVLTYRWTQVSGPSVALSDPTAASPDFPAPYVGAGGVRLVFRLMVSDDGGLTGIDELTVTIQNVTDPPSCALAQPTTALLWPPNHKMVEVGIQGVSDPQRAGVEIAITDVTQDEPVEGLADGDTAPDAVMGTDTVLLRAERSGTGNGRVYRVSFTAADGRSEGCVGAVFVGVPITPRQGATDDGQQYRSSSR